MKSFLIITVAAILTAAMLSAQTLRLPVMPNTFSFCGERIPMEIPDVRERLEDIFYSRIGNDERIFLLIRRSGRYFPMFEKLLKEAGLPDDLKYLSVAESSLRNDSYSQADAAGLWQFLPSVARLWGLRVEKSVDERFHPEKSTRAAIRVLKQLYDEFGSWSLSAAAYNTGETNIYRAQQDQRQNSYYDLFLNWETRNYVFQIAVLKEIFEHPAKYGYALKDTNYFPPYDDGTRVLTLKGPIRDIASVAKNIGTNYKTLKMLNFWIMKYDLPAGDWNLLIPVGLVFDSSAWRSPGVNDTLPVVAPWGMAFIHKVEGGESLTRIAAQYGVTIGKLLEWNDLPTDNLGVGQELKVFVPPSGKIRHTVRPGDNLNRIADYYRVSVTRLREWNRLSSDLLKAGDTLTVYAEQN